MAPSGSLEAEIAPRGVWRSASMESGGQYVLMSIGECWMLTWSAES